MKIKSNKKILITISFLLIFILTASNVYAKDASKDATVTKGERTTSQKMFRKLSRGFANIFTAPAELIKQPLIESDKAETVIGVPVGCMTGFFTGLGWMIYRVGAGVVEIITFPIPINDYKPLIEPEFII